MQQCRGNFQISPPDFSCKKTIAVANNGYWPGTAPAPPPAPAWTQMSSHETQDEESVLHTPDILRPLLLSVGDMLAGVGELSGGGSSLGPGYNESQWSAAAPGMQQPISQCVITQSNATVCTPASPVWRQEEQTCGYNPRPIIHLYCLLVFSCLHTLCWRPPLRKWGPKPDKLQHSAAANIRDYLHQATCH